MLRDIKITFPNVETSSFLEVQVSSHVMNNQLAYTFVYEKLSFTDGSNNMCLHVINNTLMLRKVNYLYKKENIAYYNSMQYVVHTEIFAISYLF